MGIIEDLQETKKKAERNGSAKKAKFLVNRKTYNALCKRGADKSMLIISELVKDGDCVMVKESPKTQSPVFPKKKTEQRTWEPIQKKKAKRATKKKRKFKKRKK